MSLSPTDATAIRVPEENLPMIAYSLYPVNGSETSQSIPPSVLRHLMTLYEQQLKNKTAFILPDG